MQSTKLLHPGTPAGEAVAVLERVPHYVYHDGHAAEPTALTGSHSKHGAAILDTMVKRTMCSRIS
jgi:hypothetical protein